MSSRFTFVPYPDSGLVRLRVTPDEPAEGPPAIIEQRPRGSRRPHTDMAVAKVRNLIERTDLTYSEISKKTGVGRASICRWAVDGKWQRPAYAPRATDLVPTLRAGRRLRMRKLAERLEALAQRYVRELEEMPNVDPDRLMQALQLVKMTRLEAMGRRRRRPPLFSTSEARTGAWAFERDAAIRTALKEMQRGGVDIDRAPKEAVDMVIEANTPVEDYPELRERGRRSKRVREHAWLGEKE
jgi:transcriptional regulator with XRE-family HTH domain